MNRPGSHQARERNPFYELERRQGAAHRKGIGFLAGIARLLILIGIGCMAGIAGVATEGYLFFTQDLPSIEDLKNYEPSLVTEVYADNGDLIADYTAERRYLVSTRKIPDMLENAFIATEDRRFWEHQGVDPKAMLAAFKDYIVSGEVRGASTITQQVAKNLLLSPVKKLERKIREVILALRIEKALSKNQILYLYLNEIYLGSGAYGVEAAARTYFGKSVEELTLAECALLGGLAQSPGETSPKVNLDKALIRRKHVLNRMLAETYITPEAYETAVADQPKLVEYVNPYRRTAPDFAEHVRRYIENTYGAKTLYEGGLKVFTTVDLDLTEAARKAMERGVQELDRRQGYRGPLKTLNVQGVREFLETKTKAMEEPLRFGDVTEGVITHIDDQYVYVRMGSYIKGESRREYVGRIEIDPSFSWWVRTPYVRPEYRTRNFEQGDLPFQVGDLILVRLVDPNVERRKLYRDKYGHADPDLKNYKRYTEDMLEYFPLEPEQNPIVEAAVMLRENRSGYVRVLLGGKDFTEAKYNRAVQARRQPGSSFKPVIYAAALNKGFTCADVILDAPIALSIPGTGEVWRPQNYRGGHAGQVTFREALVKSKNIPTIKILQQIGIDFAKAYARKIGYRSPIPNNLTMALGSGGVSLEEQMDAYSVFPNRGFLVPNVYIKKIVDRHGRVLEEHNPPILLDDPMQIDQPQIKTVSHDASAYRASSEMPKQATPVLRRRIDEGTAVIVTDLLQDVVQNGTAKILKGIVGRPDIAGKTGTTNDNIDAWFMGFSPNYTTGVWVGFDDEYSLGPGETGGKAAAPIWGYFMKEVLAGKPVTEFPTSQAVEYRSIDARTGMVTAAGIGIQEIFKVGSVPVKLEPNLVKGARWDYAGADLDQF